MIKSNVDMKHVIQVEDKLGAIASSIHDIVGMDILDPHARYALSNIQKMVHSINRAIVSERYVIMNDFEAAKDDHDDLILRAERMRMDRLKLIEDQKQCEQPRKAVSSIERNALARHHNIASIVEQMDLLQTITDNQTRLAMTLDVITDVDRMIILYPESQAVLNDYKIALDAWVKENDKESSLVQPLDSEIVEGFRQRYAQIKSLPYRASQANQAVSLIEDIKMSSIFYTATRATLDELVSQIQEEILLKQR